MSERYGKLDPVKNPNVSCENCGWVSYAVTRQEAEEAVASFKAYYDGLTAKEQREYYGASGPSTIEKDYRCQRCGKTAFRRTSQADAVAAAGHTIGPVVWEMKPEYMDHLVEIGYQVILPKPGYQWVALYKFIFTTAIIVGNLDDYVGYSDRWCYHTHEDALKGLVTWIADGYEGEPTGWHRHPRTGRRAGPDHEFNEALKELSDDED